MAALLRQSARRIGGSVIQRTQAAAASPAAAEERRRLVPRRMYTTEEGAGMKKDRRESFRRFDKHFTQYLNASAGLYVIYYLLFPKDLGQMDAAQAQADKK